MTETATPPPQAPAASISLRLFAFLIDGLIVAFFTGMAISFVNPPEGSAGEIVAGLAVYAVFFLYHAVLNARPGATPGKRLAGIRALDLEGKPLTFGRSALRAFGYFLSAIPLGAGFFWAMVDAQGRGLHDRIAGTRVAGVRADKPVLRYALVSVAWILLAGTLLGALYRGLGKPALDDFQSVAAGKQTLQALAQLEERHHSRSGTYTDSLLVLSTDADDPPELLESLPRVLVAETITLQANEKTYRVSARAQDSEHTQLQLIGPVAPERR